MTFSKLDFVEIKELALSKERVYSMTDVSRRDISNDVTVGVTSQHHKFGENRIRSL